MSDTTRPSARSAKIITVGASTTAMLGMMAGFAIADRPPSPPTAVAAQPALQSAPAPAPAPAPATTVPVATVPVVVELATPVTPVLTAPPATSPASTAPPPPPPPPQAVSTGS